VRELLLIGALAAALIILPAASANAYLFFTPKKAAVVSGDRIAVNGTSAPSNATRTKCTVQFRDNGGTYSPVIPLGKGPANYTKWRSNGAMTIHPGVNTLEGKFQCFPPSLPEIPEAPNFVHFLTHNVTGA